MTSMRMIAAAALMVVAGGCAKQAEVAVAIPWIKTTEELLEELLEELESEEAPQYVANTARELCARDEPAAIGACVDLLDHESELVRRQVAESLSEVGANAVEPLMAKLAGQNEDAVESALMALGLIADPRALESMVRAYRDLDDAEHSTTEAFDEFGASAIEHLVSLLEDEDADVRRRALTSLSRIDDPGIVPPLVVHLTEREGREAVLQGLSAQREVAFQPLLDALGGEDAELSAAAADALGELAKRDWAEGLIDALGDEREVVRLHAVKALAAVDAREAVPQILPLIHDESAEVRAAASLALGELGDTGDLPELVELIADEDMSVRDAALASCRRLLRLLDADEEPDPVMIEKLEGMLGDADPRVVLLAAELLMRFDTTAVIPPVVAILERGRHGLQHAAFELLARIHDPLPVEHLRIAMRSKNPMLVSRVIHYLRATGHPAAIPLLIDALDVGSRSLEYQAWETLVRITCQDLGREPGPWKRWWKKNRKTWQGSCQTGAR